MYRPPNWPKCSQIFSEGTWMILEIKYYVQVCFMTPKLLLKTCLIFCSNLESLLANWGSNSPWVIVGNGFSNGPKVTWIYEQRKGMCKGIFFILIWIIFHFIQDDMTLSKTAPKSQFHPWGKCSNSSPNAIKMSKTDSNV